MPETDTVPRGQASPARSPDDPITFAEVFDREIAQIEQARELREVPAQNVRDTLIGLAFSGGGIRSATFNLGILQALADSRLLSKFDYLSTVSGGGYIGSWLAALTRRLTEGQSPKKFSSVEDLVLRAKAYAPGTPGECRFVRWLRNYSDYLTPRVGAFSGDTWAMVGTYLRNVILNLVVLVTFLLGLSLVPSTLVLFSRDILLEHPQYSLLAGGVLVLLATGIMASSMMAFVSSRGPRRTFWQRNQVALGVIFPVFAAACLLNSALWAWKETGQSPLWYWTLGAAVFYSLVWGLGFGVFLSSCAPRGEKGHRLVSWPALICSAGVAGALGGLLLHQYAVHLQAVERTTGSVWYVVVLGTAAVVSIMLLVAVLHLGFVGSDCADLIREWWARAGGGLLLTSLVWGAVFAVVVFGPLGVRMMLATSFGGAKGISALLAWVGSSWGGILAGKSAKTGGEKAASELEQAGSKLGAVLKLPQVLDVVAKVAPYIFAVGLLVLLATGMHVGVGMYFAPGQTHAFWDLRLAAPNIWESYWAIQSQGRFGCLGLGALVLIGLAWLLSLRVDVNDFSLHHFYRNRLVRCYLGASNLDRNPQPFTGFDPRDDIGLADLLVRDPRRPDLPGACPGLYPILNASLNVTRGEELGFQKRMAKSFVFTPLYCGYDLTSRTADRLGAQVVGAYLPTHLGRKQKLGHELRGITLGTAMAISGAAASPNMGHYTSAATAFFMTLFDVRLGWWMGNPKKPRRWESPGPANGLAYLLSELVARSDEDRDYIYLSDGGHFENLAIYELLKRRCRVIVACDSGADGGYCFSDLTSAIEKARIDFGVEVQIDVSGIKPQPKERVSARSYAIGDIYYGPNDQGKLIYIKTSLPKDNPNACAEGRTPADVQGYANVTPDFPHQTTADQWFDEAQFESYRALGHYIGTLAARAIGGAIRGDAAR